TVTPPGAPHPARPPQAAGGPGVPTRRGARPAVVRRVRTGPASARPLAGNAPRRHARRDGVPLARPPHRTIPPGGRRGLFLADEVRQPILPVALLQPATFAARQ